MIPSENHKYWALSSGCSKKVTGARGFSHNKNFSAPDSNVISDLE